VSHRLGEIAVGVSQRTYGSRERRMHGSRGSARERSLGGRCHHALERVQEILFVEWFAQKGERTGLQGLRLQTPVRVVLRGDEYDGNARALRNQKLLQLQSAHPRKAHIQDQARGSLHAIGPQELGRGRETFGAESGRSKQAADGLAQRRFIIHDCNQLWRAIPAHDPFELSGAAKHRKFERT